MNKLFVYKDPEPGEYCERCGHWNDRRAASFAPTLGARVRLAREQLGWSLHELAAAAGLSCGYLSKIENDRSVLSLRTLEGLARTLGRSVIWFVEPLNSKENHSNEAARDDLTVEQERPT